MKKQDAYENGQAWAKEVQQGLKEGKTFEQQNTLTPEEAMKAREWWRKHDEDCVRALDGYLSRWD